MVMERRVLDDGRDGHFVLRVRNFKFSFNQQYFVYMSVEDAIHSFVKGTKKRN